MADKPVLTIPESAKKVDLICHRIYAPVVIPEPDKVVPNKLNITPRFGNFSCMKERCSLWNSDAQECYDVTQAKGLALLGQLAFNKLNDVSIDGGGN